MHDPDLIAILSAALTDPEAGWSMGSFGAICEFHHVAGDPVPAPGPGCRVVTALGGMVLDRLEDVRPVAWEALSPRPQRWQQGVALCLPVADHAMAGRVGLTELGPDTAALRAQDRDAVLFDLGLGQSQVDYCIRTADPELLAILRGQSGRSVFDPGNPVMPAILPRHPHRISISRIGRMEVYQKIGGPDTGGVSPVGPHTHLLPQFLRSGRTHSANTPIPEGWVPVAGFHPASAVMDPLGADRAFDNGRFAAFATLLDRWGDPRTNAIKAAVRQAVENGTAPGDFAAPSDRFGRVALRVALRQAARCGVDADRVAQWQMAFDRIGDPADADAPGH